MQVKMSNNPKFILHMSNEDLKERLFLVKHRLEIRTKKELAEKLGCSRPMLHLYETGQNEPPIEFYDRLDVMEHDAGIRQIVKDYTNDNNQTSNKNSSKLEDLEAGYLPKSNIKVRSVPKIGMAHAGQVVDYDEIEKTAQEYVPTLCQDPLAFALDIEGDSMFPKVKDRDCVIITPSTRPHNGCIIVARLKGDGVVCRRVETLAGKIRLIPENQRYDVTLHEEEDFDWMYPVFGAWSQMLRE